MAYSDRYLLFFEYFNKGKFMSAQTTLEVVWMEEEGGDQEFYGGLIQTAVSLFHLTNENPRGGQKVWEKARGMLSAYGDDYLGVNLKKLRSDFDELYQSKVDLEDPTVDVTGLPPTIDFKSE